ncbi:MAG: 5'/3'-nucleotidase SurE [Stenotrophobium sp.]
MKIVMRILCAALWLTASAQAHALNILLSNDDGFETANIRALYQTLKQAGNDVVLSAPTQNNSGTGGAMNFLKPVTPLAKDSRYGTIKAGAPGVGADPNDPDIHYVDGTPVMSLLYGLDVIAAQHWHGQPDLVISGPNEGSNDGMINNSSGTVNNALYGINRGIPSIAVSYAGTGSRAYKALAGGAPEYELAGIVLKLVQQLQAHRGADSRLLPPGVGLNVNVPVFQTGQAARLPFHFTRMGVATDYEPVFYNKLSDSPTAVGFGAGVDYPGISFVIPPQTAPAGVVLPDDRNADSEANALKDKVVTVTVIEGLPQARRSNEDAVKFRLHALFASGQGK